MIYDLIKHYKNGTVKTQSWYEDARLHRNDDLPAVIEYYENGTLKRQEWHRNGRAHRDGDLPDVILYHQNGTIRYQSWSKNGRWHRETGPAIIQGEHQCWFLLGVPVSEKTVMSPHDLTLKDITSKRNAESRRIMIERMGIEKYLSLANPKILDVDSHNFNGTRALMKTRQGVWLVCACPSTGRVYHMEVPPEKRTCEEADQYLRDFKQGQIIGAS